MSKSFALIAFAALMLGVGVNAGVHAQSADKPLLTITGKVSSAGPDGVVFDRAKLEALGMQSIETRTPWHTDVVKFEGVPLEKLMDAVGASGDRIQAVALNDYSVEIPIADFAKYHAILAIKRDGQYMPVRDKGPLFVIYPYDSDPELRSQKYYSRSAWQVNRIIVK